jgi:hypothetical protein
LNCWTSKVLKGGEIGIGINSLISGSAVLLPIVLKLKVSRDISSPAKLMYKSIPLDWEHVVHIAHELARTRTRTQTAYNNIQAKYPGNMNVQPVISLE